MKEQLHSKTDVVDFKAVSDQLSRFALYEDYKSLYAKVVPPISAFEEHIEQMRKQITQFETIIRTFDENL